MTYATVNHTSKRTHDSLTTVFKQPISAVDIAALKTRIESNYRVTFLYSGNEFDYTVILEGAEGPFTHAMNTLYPKGRPDIVIQRAQSIG